MMTYVLYGLAGAYLLWGMVLTYTLRSGLHRRGGFMRDWLLGPLVLPVLFLIGLAFMAWEKLWARLMIVLDLDPPEEMRAGPAPKPGAKGAN